MPRKRGRGQYGQGGFGYNRGASYHHYNNHHQYYHQYPRSTRPRQSFQTYNWSSWPHQPQLDRYFVFGGHQQLPHPSQFRFHHPPSIFLGYPSQSQGHRSIGNNMFPAPGQRQDEDFTSDPDIGIRQGQDNNVNNIVEKQVNKTLQPPSVLDRAKFAFFSAINLSQTVSQLNDSVLMDTSISSAQSVMSWYKNNTSLALDMTYFFELLLEKHETAPVNSANLKVKILMIFVGLARKLKINELLIENVNKPNEDQATVKLLNIITRFQKLFTLTCNELKQNLADPGATSFSVTAATPLIKILEGFQNEVESLHLTDVQTQNPPSSTNSSDSNKSIDSAESINMNTPEKDKEEELMDEQFDLDRVLYNEFYWKRKELFIPALDTSMTSDVVKIVTNLVEIFGKSKLFSPFHEDEEYFHLILDDCDGFKWTNTARNAVIWTLNGVLETLESSEKFSTENAEQLEQIMNEYDIKDSFLNAKWETLELFSIWLHLRRYLPHDYLSPITALVSRLTDKRYIFSAKDFPFQDALGIQEFYPRNLWRLDRVVDKVLKPLPVSPPDLGSDDTICVVMLNLKV